MARPTPNAGVGNLAVLLNFNVPEPQSELCGCPHWEELSDSYAPRSGSGGRGWAMSVRSGGAAGKQNPCLLTAPASLMCCPALSFQTVSSPPHIRSEH